MEWKQFLILLNYTFIKLRKQGLDRRQDRFLDDLLYIKFKMCLKDNEKNFWLILTFYAYTNGNVDCESFIFIQKALTQHGKAIVTKDVDSSHIPFCIKENISRLSLLLLQPMSLVGSVLAATEFGNAERKQSSDPAEPESERLWLRCEFCWWAEARGSVTPTSASSRAGHTNPHRHIR